MNNLSDNNQTAQQTAQNAFLTNKVNQTLDHYRNADTAQRIATIRHIDSFPVHSKVEKVFWLRTRYQLERMNEKDALPLDVNTVINRLPSLSADDRETFINQTALNYSAILADENTPSEKRQSVKNLIIDLFNDHAEQSETEKIEESFEYIRAVLRGVSKKFDR